MARRASDRASSSTKSSWGGARPGAGRKPTGKAGAPHRARPEVDGKKPLLTTLRTVKGFESLKKKKLHDLVLESIGSGGEREGFRIVQHSVRGDQIDLVVEAADTASLSRGMKGLQIRIARGLNGLLGRSGKVFADRYSARLLNSPKEVREATADFSAKNGRSKR